MDDIKTFKYHLGMHIRDVRDSRHVTQEVLAEMTGISRTYMGFIEQGRRLPSLTRLIRISKALNITVSQLLDFDWIPIDRDNELSSDENDADDG